MSSWMCRAVAALPKCFWLHWQVGSLCVMWMTTVMPAWLGRSSQSIPSSWSGEVLSVDAVNTFRWFMYLHSHGSRLGLSVSTLAWLCSWCRSSSLVPYTGRIQACIYLQGASNTWQLLFGLLFVVSVLHREVWRWGLSGIMCPPWEPSVNAARAAHPTKQPKG